MVAHPPIKRKGAGSTPAGSTLIIIPMKTITPTIIEMDGRILERARALQATGKGLRARTFGVLHGILDLWNEQRRPAQFKFTYAALAAIVNETEEAISEDVCALKAAGLLVRIRHGNQYTPSEWQFGTALATPTATPKEAAAALAQHDQQRAAQTPPPAPEPVSTASAPPTAFAPKPPGAPQTAADLLAQMQERFAAATASQPSSGGLQTFSNTATADCKTLATRQGLTAKKCNTAGADCTPPTPYYSSEFKNTEYLSIRGDGRRILKYEDVPVSQRPWVIDPKRAHLPVHDHRRYIGARFNPASACAFLLVFDGEARPQRDLNALPPNWANDFDSAVHWLGSWAWAFGMDPTYVMMEWQGFFAGAQPSVQGVRNRTAFFTAHCFKNYDRLRMTAQRFEEYYNTRCPHSIISL